MKTTVATVRRTRPLHAAAVATAVLASLGLSACSGGSGDSADGTVHLSFSWWGDSTRAASTEAAIKVFEKAHPKIKVSTTYAQFGPYNQKLATQMAGGGAPDLIQIDWGNQSQYAQSNTLMDLSSGPAKVDFSGLDPKFAGSGKSGDKQVALPFGQATQSIVVDVTKLKSLGVPVPKPGWTWNDVASFGKAVHDKSHGKVSGITDPGITWAAFQSWLDQRGTSLYTKDGKLGFTQADLEGFWNFCDALRKSGAATPANQTTTFSNGPAEDPLAKGTTVAEWDYDSIYASHAAANKDRLTLLPLPSVNGKTGMYAKPSMLLSVYAGSKHPKEAAELLGFLINDPKAAKALGTSRGMFPNLKARESQAADATGGDKVVSGFEKANQAGLSPTPTAPPKGDGQLITLMQREYGSISFGQESVKAGAKDFMTQAKQALAK
ncbi:ABC transporter substrate-binding protein [Streptomyces sp. NRRL F-5126]|uniref:ABC transporter substrate-binding protein n=1 Tax=Streptomyces sp. NRRL F-5126 TaxID=1463857 RepID=UPI0004CADA82|nr:extracellular solute-binding protein [Streptomyces sp. NRRL F-5126]